MNDEDYMPVDGYFLSADNFDCSINIKEKTATLLANECDSDNVMIPRSIYNNFVVTQIIQTIFMFCDHIKAVQFAPDSEVRSFNPGLFICTSIESLDIPSKLSELKEGWCYGTKNLNKININPVNPYFKIYDKGKFIIGKSSPEKENFDVLVFCVRDVVTANIPDFIEIIEPYSFQYCEKIKKIKFSSKSKIRMIKSSAFQYSSIKEIKNYQKYRLCQKTKTICLIKKKLFIYSKSSPEKENFDVLKFAVKSIEKVEIPEFIEIIGAYAFSGCTNLKEVKFSKESKLRIIEENAFSISSIEKVSIPNCVFKIGKESFCNCKDLRIVDIQPNSELQIIEEDAFIYTAIERISIPSKLKSISKRSFFGCKNLKEIEIPMNSELQTINENAFCDTQIEIISIPSSVNELKTNCFNKMAKLSKIVSNSKHYLAYKNEFIFAKSSPEKENFDVFIFAIESIEKVEIPDFIEVIGAFAFNGCKNLKEVKISNESKLRIIEENAFSETQIECFTIPPCLKIICEESFCKCKNLNELEIPLNSELQTIGEKAFYDTQIESFTIPSQLKIIRKNTFSGCKNLHKIEIQSNSNLQTIEENAFLDTKIESFTIPSIVIDIKEGWLSCMNDLISIKIDPNNKCYSMYENKLIIGKSSPDKDHFDVLVFAQRNIKEAFIPSFIEIIHSYAFYKCKKLRKVEFAKDSKLKCIGKQAFSQSSIKKIFLPHQTTKICEKAFENCNELEYVEIPENSELKVIQKSSFHNSSIRSIFIPSNLKIIENSAFEYCIDTQIIEIDENCKLVFVDPKAYYYSNLSILIMIPVKLINEPEFKQLISLFHESS